MENKYVIKKNKMKANIEINDREYLIKFKREDFSLEFISQCLTRIFTEKSVSNGRYPGDIITRTFNYDVSNRFDHLDDK